MGWDELTAGYPVIVLEGCDGTGKTTMATRLAQHYGYTAVRCGRIDDAADLAGRYRAVFSQPGLLALDRSFVSEVVYGTLRGGQCRLTPRQAADLAFALADRGGLLVHLTAPADVLAVRLRARDGYAPPLDRISAVIKAYRDVFDGLAGAVPIVAGSVFDFL
jgi:thymidylate kinase